jgi:hypothetical protein
MKVLINLQSALVNRPRLLAESTMRPDHLYSLLISLGVANKKYAVEAISESYPNLVFRSQERLFIENLAVLKSVNVINETMTFKDYTSLLPYQREIILRTLIKKNHQGVNLKKQIYAFLNLNELILVQKVLAALRKHMLEFINTMDLKMDGTAKSLTEMSTLLKKMMTSNQIVDLGQSYGIPTTDEVLSMNTKEADLRFGETKKFMNLMLVKFRYFLPEKERQELADEENLVKGAQSSLPQFK